MTNKPVIIDHHPGRSSQTIGIARELGTDPDLIHEPSVGVVGTKGDSQCYMGVMAKVDAIHASLKSRIGKGAGQLKLRLVQPEYTIATSDGIRNGTREMRYSLIGREMTNDALCEHLSATGLAGTIAVVACDKPPVGTLAALLEHNQPSIIMSDGPIHPGTDPKTGEKLDIVSAYQVAGHPDAAHRLHIACHACPGYGSCGGMFTYNTMQTFIGVVGMQPLHMVAPPSDDPRRVKEFPDQLVGYLAQMMAKGLKPRDIVVRDSIRNAVIVAMAIGGSTNVTLHAPEIARAAGYGDFWKDVMTPEEFNHLSQYVVPVLTDARPYGKYSMVDIDEVGGVQVIVKELLDAGLLNGDVMTCTGETLAEQVKRLGTKAVDGKVIYPVAKPYKPTGGLRVLGGNLSPDFSAILKLAGVEGGLQNKGVMTKAQIYEGGLENNVFRGKARVFEGEQGLIDALDKDPDSFQNNDMIIVRYEGPSGAPGMPEMLDPTSRITTLCRERRIDGGADDRRALLRRLGRPRHRPRRPGGGTRRPHRARSGRRRNHCRPQQERAQLHGALRPGSVQAAQGRVGQGGRGERRHPPELRRRRHAPAAPCAAHRRSGDARRRPASEPRGLGARAARGQALGLCAEEQAPAGNAKSVLIVVGAEALRADTAR